MTRYSPWDDLASREDVAFLVTRLPAGTAWWMPEERGVVMDDRLSRVERRCAMAHELAHVDHGDVCTGDKRIDARQETWADQDAAHRLIDLDDLVDALRWSSHEAEVAEDLQITPHMLRVRIKHLHPSERAYVRRELEGER